VIERFDWTDHARRRVWERGFDRIFLEKTIRLGHHERSLNKGQADWRVRGERHDGRAFAVAYDHPVGKDRGRVRIVSVWLCN
jgi:hypothetical protein